MSKLVTVYVTGGSQEAVELVRRGLSFLLPAYQFLVTMDEEDIMETGKVLAFFSGSERFAEHVEDEFGSELFERLKARGNVMFVVLKFAINADQPYFETSKLFNNAPLTMLNYHRDIDTVFDLKLPSTQSAAKSIKLFLGVGTTTTNPPARKTAPPRQPSPPRRRQSPPPRARSPPPKQRYEPPAAAKKPAAAKLKGLSFEDGVNMGRLVQLRAEREHLQERLLQLDHEEKMLEKYH